MYRSVTIFAQQRSRLGRLAGAAVVVLALGGCYHPREPIASVLATTDGSRFSEVTQLPAPGRYLAVAALGGRIFAFGGESASGSANDAIQEVDPKAGTARVVGHLLHLHPMVDGEGQELCGLGAARRRPVHVVDRLVLPQRLEGAAMLQEILQLLPGRDLG